MGVELRNRILILGGGFAGLYTALELERTVAGHSYVQVTLVNRENFFLFTPMLHEVAASDIDITHIVNPIRKLLRKVKFFHGEVQAIDLPSRRVHVVHGPEHHPHYRPGQHRRLCRLLRRGCHRERDHGRQG